MKKIGIVVLITLRKLFHSKKLKRPKVEDDIDNVSVIIYDKLMLNEPCMIGRFGAFELGTIVNYIGVKKGINILKFLNGTQPAWWWNENLIKCMQLNAGFFPSTAEKLSQFGELMLSDTGDLDILGSWLANEQYIQDELKYCKKVSRGQIDPFWAKKPWTMALENKKVLVIHPFSKSIESQYNKRKLIFKNDVLPSFDLITYKPVVSFAANNVDFNDWFEALEFMKNDISKIDFDICLIGAGAYGFPLAAHVKRMGKKSVHIGGSLQLFFGIRGNRWDNEKVIGKVNYQELFNEHWVRPLDEEQPESKSKVENGAYW